MRVILLSIVLLAVLCPVVMADPGHLEVSVVQRALVGDPFIGTVGSYRLGCVVLPPMGKIDLFMDGGIRLSETTEASFTGGLVGASVGERDKALRVGAGYAYPNGFTVYVRACVTRW